MQSEKYKLKEVKYTSLIEMIYEAKRNNAFIPLKDDDEIFLDYMKQLEGTKGCHFFTFHQIDSQTVGFATILPHKDEKILSIGPIYIMKDFQGQGLGRKLVVELISWAKRSGLKGLFTKTWGENIRSRSIFEGLGFKFKKEKLNDRVNGDSSVHYFLSLL